MATNGLCLAQSPAGGMETSLRHLPASQHCRDCLLSSGSQQAVPGGSTHNPQDRMRGPCPGRRLPGWPCRSQKVLGWHTPGEAGEEPHGQFPGQDLSNACCCRGPRPSGRCSGCCQHSSPFPARPESQGQPGVRSFQHLLRSWTERGS